MPAERFDFRVNRRRRFILGVAFNRQPRWSCLAIMAVGCLLWMNSVAVIDAQPPTRETPPGTKDSRQAAAVSDATREHFETRVRPLLSNHCYECHSGQSEKLRAGLRLDSGEAVRAGGESGPVVVPGRPDESPLLAAVRHETVAMPPSSKLSEEQIADLERWIREGAWWPEESTTKQDSKDSNIVSPAEEMASRKAAHWSWRTLSLPAVPNVNTPSWARNDVDRFILSGLEKANLPPAPEASRETLLRRLSFDLRGLPPTPAEMDLFLADRSPDAYERLVDRLMSTPQFGEKWARHWLDLVRFAETCGHEFDYPLHHAFQYRDYVVRAWNEDTPYDLFVREHVAGDLLREPRINPANGCNESIMGTGFWWLGEANHAPTDVRADEADRMDNQLSVFGKTFLGLTIGCARCHDHKFDPITTADYYSLAGFLQSTRRQEALLDPGGTIATAVDAMKSLRTEADAKLQADLSAAARTPDYWSGLLSRVAGLGNESATTTKDDGRMERWRAALTAQPLDSPTHPLHLWKRLTDAGDARNFVDRDQAASEEWQRWQTDADRSWNERPSFVDFARDDLSGWFLTGQAFHASTLASPGQADWTQSLQPPQLVRPGTVDSGLLGKRLQGVLRSPTFTLEHPQIHHLIRGRHIQIRLIVDGYVMDLFNPLLFGDHTLRDVNTNGQYQWVTQRNDLTHYLGHKAHLEYIDHGEGDFSLAAVVFSKEGPPTEQMPVQLAKWFAATSDSAASSGATSPRTAEQPHRSMDSLVTFYGNWIHTALRESGAGRASKGDTDLVNWLLQNELVLSESEVATWREHAGRIQEREAALPVPMPVLAATDGTSEDEYLHIRGSSRNRGRNVPRQMIVAISGESQPSVSFGSGRLELANRMLDDGNPFPARVIANRLWHHLFHRGIVASVDDFGVMGQEPTHPELLDWLASDLRSHGWSLKRTLRILLTSSTYRMDSTRRSSDIEERDPANSLWHRMEARRMTAENLHDSILALSGRLENGLYGPSVPVYLDEFTEGRGRPESGPLDRNGRRGLYVRVQRNFMSPLLVAFDMPTPFGTVGRRSDSNVPAQSLILMNDPFVWDQSRDWGQRLLRLYPDPISRVRQAARYAWAREATMEEEQRLLRFVDEQAREYGIPVDDERVWTDLCHALFNTKEFLFIR